MPRGNNSTVLALSRISHTDTRRLFHHTPYLIRHASRKMLDQMTLVFPMRLPQLPPTWTHLGSWTFFKIPTEDALLNEPPPLESAADSRFIAMRALLPLTMLVAPPLPPGIECFGGGGIDLARSRSLKFQTLAFARDVPLQDLRTCKYPCKSCVFYGRAFTGDGG